MKITVDTTTGTTLLKDIVLATYPDSLDRYSDGDIVYVMNFDATKNIGLTIGRHNTIQGDGIPVNAGFEEGFTFAEFKKLYALASGSITELYVSIRNKTDLEHIKKYTIK